MITKAVWVKSISEWKRVVNVFQERGYQWKGSYSEDELNLRAFSWLGGNVIVIVDGKLGWGYKKYHEEALSFEEFMKGLK